MLWAVILSIVSVVSLVLGLALGIDMLKQYRRIRKTPLSFAGKPPDGMIAVCGTAQSFLDAVAPFTRTAVAWCHSKVTQMAFTDDGKVRPVATDQLFEEKMEHPFYIEDSSGRILVAPRNGMMDVPPSYTYENHKLGVGQVTSRMPDPDIRKALDEAGVAYSTTDGPLPITCTEAAIAVGDTVYARGECSSRKEDIEEALKGIDLLPGESVTRILKPPAGGKDQLYVTPGDPVSASSSMFTTGVGVLIGGLVVALVAGLIALRLWQSAF